MSKIRNFIPEKKEQSLPEENQKSVIVEFKKDGVTTILKSSGNIYKMVIKKGERIISIKRLSPLAFRKTCIEILDGIIESEDVPPIKKKEKTNETPEELTEIKEPAVEIGIGE